MIDSDSVQGKLANSILKVYPDALVKKIDKDNFLDIHIPSVNEKKGTHLFFNVSMNEIKFGFYVRDEAFIRNAILNQFIESYSSGIRPKDNPVFSNEKDAVKAAISFIKNIRKEGDQEATNETMIIQNDTPLVKQTVADAPESKTLVAKPAQVETVVQGDSKYPKAIQYLKNQARTTSADIKLQPKIFKLDILEEILNFKDIDEYLKLDRKVYQATGVPLRWFNLLYRSWLCNEISDLNIDVYCKNFKVGQDIVYFRDLFYEVKESRTMTSRGESIELKAYGKSKKIDREFIAFVGHFRDGKLTSFTDKTDEAENYLAIQLKASGKHKMIEASLIEFIGHCRKGKFTPLQFQGKLPLDLLGYDLYTLKGDFYTLNSDVYPLISDFYTLNMRLLETLIENGAIEILSANTIKHCLEIDYLPIDKLIEKVTHMTEKDAFHNDDQGHFYFNSVFLLENDFRKIDPEFKKFEKHFKTNTLGDPNGYVELDSVLSPLKRCIDNYRASVVRVTQYYKSDLPEKLEGRLHLIKPIAVRRVANTIKQCLEIDYMSIDKLIEAVTLKTETDAFHYDDQGHFYFNASLLLEDNFRKIDPGFKNFKRDSNGYVDLDSVMSHLKRCIDNYRASVVKVSQYHKSDLPAKLEARLTLIKSIAVRRISESKHLNSKNSIKNVIITTLKWIGYGVLLYIIYRNINW